MYDKLYEINENVRCLICGNRGAVQSYGKYYSRGLGSEVDKFQQGYIKDIMEKHRNSPYMSRSCGFGGTIPWKCLNCGSIGLIDFGELECYKQAFKTIKE